MAEIKLWEHLPVRPNTFSNFRKLKSNYNFPGLKSDNAFLEELLRVYEMRLVYLEKKRRENKQNV